MKVNPCAIRATTNKTVTLQYILIQDDLKRLVTVKGPYKNWGSIKTDSYQIKMMSVFNALTKLSDIPENPTRQEFLDLTFKELPNLTITNELISCEDN